MTLHYYCTSNTQIVGALPYNGTIEQETAPHSCVCNILLCSIGVISIQQEQTHTKGAGVYQVYLTEVGKVQSFLSAEFQKVRTGPDGWALLATDRRRTRQQGNLLPLVAPTSP